MPARPVKDSTGARFARVGPGDADTYVTQDVLVSSHPSELLGGWNDSAARQDTWQPAADVDLRDGRGLHELLYHEGDLRRPRPWCAPATDVLVDQAIETLQARLAELSPGDTIRVLDYGTGTGLAAIELLKACRSRGLEERLERCGVSLELHLVDIPTSWFAQGFALLGACEWTRFHALTDADGRFRSLSEVTAGQMMDIVLTSMVFHLIPATALPRAVGALAGVTAPGGRLLWNAPDVGVPEPRTILFHDPNRALRARWCALLAGDARPASAAVREAVVLAREGRDEASARAADERADRRILRRAHTGPELARVLSSHFEGSITTASHEMVTRETLDTLLVPSNQEEYLPEIEDFSLRCAVIEDLMLEEVLPELRAGPAATPQGLNIHWTLGDFRRRGGAAA